MSVAAMTMDDQRPLMNNYDKMSTKYDSNLHMLSSGSGGGGVVAGSNGNAAGVAAACSNSGPSGPASPTPSGSEELPTSLQQQQQHHHHHHHHHHHSTSTQAQQTQEPQLPQQQPSRHHHHQQQQQQLQQHQQQHQKQQQEHDVAVADAAVAAAAEQRRLLEDEIENLKMEQARLGLQCADAQRREKILMRRLANKEQEFQDYVSQIAEYKAQQAPTALALRTALLDPAVNLLFERLKKELKATKAKLEETQNELSAWKFTPDSNTGKRLMAKCRLLYQENEELGKMTSNGRLAKLESELAMQKSFSEEVKKSQSELDDFLQELDEDVEGMQSTILFLQQELKTTRDRIHTLEKENTQLRQTSNSPKETNDIATMAGTAAINGQSASNSNQFQTISSNLLHPNDENVVQETSVLATTSAVIYYNGINNDKQATVPEIITLDESNTSRNGAAARLARKRNYEEEGAPASCVHEAPVVPTIREISTPRTLPPKKSKLRGLVTRRNSQLEDEQQALNPVTATPLAMDHMVLNVVPEESTLTTTSVTTNTVDPATPAPEDSREAPTTTPARILTRRRSVRMQQNGTSGIDY
ncbi:pre-mRNA-splicing regulator female-lethal(2)D isoform X1 [Drosophila nasuta]|uniref:pre-mRNA-splicing regulator female-lethal(2)D isoform X1 n=2 Tax=Drosophila nasuta TaxID=42062 RepID=UPI00295F4B64|nr:pre-mRNA-splicing regulator female-lethal(2)D isoform X1 [Drosophila nasuta]